ncbi:MAG: DUF4345 domain-containing protein [Phycisphaerae bacterium]|nr:DUF4345 domain-containing protein [Phycisphaerae bacterium]NIP50503.1 DUF4345 domain-containing protein [Phycisphaerae bacterium]NIX26189.1 DUF4345 domain-containing protein [Phycisphaerae bacterium]
MNTQLFLNLLGASITAGLGTMALFRPSLAAAFTSIQPKDVLGVSEIRATYGGFFLALGAYALYSQNTTTFMVAGVAWIGAAAGRTLSVFLDRSYQPKNFGGIVLEAGVGTLLLL